MRKSFSHLVLLVLLLGGVVAEPMIASASWLADEAAESRLDSGDGQDDDGPAGGDVARIVSSRLAAAGGRTATVFLACESTDNARSLELGRIRCKTGPPEHSPYLD